MKRTASFLFILSSTFLVACDPGAKTLSDVNEKYAHVKDHELSSANAEDATIYAGALKILAKAHSDKTSGETAQKQLLDLQKKAQVRSDWIKSEHTRRSKMIEPALAGLIEQSKDIKKLGLKAEAFRYSPKINTCAVQVTGPEFSEKPPYVDFKIYKILKVGTQDALIEQIFAATDSDLSPDQVQSAIDRLTSPKKESQFVSTASVYDCNKALKFADAYRSLLIQYKDELSPLAAESGQLSQVMSSEIF